MSERIIFIGNKEDKKQIENFVDKFPYEIIRAEIIFPEKDEETIQELTLTKRLVVCLTPNYDKVIFQILKGRKIIQAVDTIVVFLDITLLNPRQESILEGYKVINYSSDESDLANQVMVDFSIIEKTTKKTEKKTKNKEKKEISAKKETIIKEEKEAAPEKPTVSKGEVKPKKEQKQKEKRESAPKDGKFNKEPEIAQTQVVNQYDANGNIILPVYDEPKKKSGGLILGIIFAALIIGAGIWGYSAYVGSADKGTDENLYNAWSEYLDDTEAGQMFSTLGEMFLRQDAYDFKEYGFHNFIEGKIEPTENIGWGNIGPIIQDIKLYYTTPIAIETIMSHDLNSLYGQAMAEGFEDSNRWNPIKELNNSRVITIEKIYVNSNFNEIAYQSADHYSASHGEIMRMVQESGIWKITDFIKNNESFSSILNEYIDEINAPQQISYDGMVYTNAGTFPIKLSIDYESSPIRAIYTNLTYDVTLEMSGRNEEGNVELSTYNNGEKISFDLKKGTDEILSGKFSSTSSSGNVKSFDVLLKPVSFDPSDISETQIRTFISGYYDAIDNGNYLSYFEDNDVTFFDLEHVNKDAIQKRMNGTTKRDTKHVYDWSTLNISNLPSGDIKAVYSSDYYIYYQDRTDKYRITTEMIISPNQKIRSIKDIKTNKIGSITESNSNKEIPTLLHLAGKIDGKYAVHMELNLKSKRGTYYYDKYGSSNSMVLSVEDYDPSISSKLVLKEYNKDGKYCGEWKGVLQNGQYTGEGIFLGNTMPFVLQYD